MDESRIDIPQTPQVTGKAEDEGGKGTQSISSSIRQTPEITEKTEDEGGKTIDSSMQKSIDNRPGSSQPPEIANYQVAIPAQSNNVPHMFPLGLFHRLPDRPENIESLLLARDRQCNFEELVKNMIDNTPKIRKWYVGVERRLGASNTELGRMMARSGLLLLEFLRFLALPDLRQSSKEFFQPKERQLSVQEAVIKIDNRIPFFVLKKILEWERDADKDENRLGSDGDADGDADTDLHYVLKHAWFKLSPIHDSLVIDEVQLKDDSHLLEFLYENIIGSSDFKHAYNWRKIKRRVRHISLPQAEPLKGKGVKFAPNEGPLNKICFNRRNRRLYLPAIEMDSGTDAVLRNLVLFEASKQEKRSQPLMSYVDLMDRLIDTSEDVQALIDGGIIHNHLGSNNDVAKVWNGMRRLLPNKKIKYEPIDNAIYDVISFYTNKHAWIAWITCMDSMDLNVLRRIAWIACISLALTVLQTLLAGEQVRLQRLSMPKT